MYINRLCKLRLLEIERECVCVPEMYITLHYKIN